MNAIYPSTDLPIVGVMISFCLIIAVGVYALAQAAFWQVRDDITGG